MVQEKLKNCVRGQPSFKPGMGAERKFNEKMPGKARRHARTACCLPQILRECSAAAAAAAAVAVASLAPPPGSSASPEKQFL